MQVGDKKFYMKGHGFLPRDKAIECYHQPGNRLFGIKFRVSPILFEKKINFSEYRGFIYPLSYLLAADVIEAVKSANTFEERTQILSHHYQSVIKHSTGPQAPVSLVVTAMNDCYNNNNFNIRIEELAIRNNISSRTVQRYFRLATGVSPKKLLQIMRIRKATAAIVSDPLSFRYADYGYYDHSHFYKHLKQFLKKETIQNIQPHLELLKTLQQH
jgi:AraC-like DNA-binding protein